MKIFNLTLITKAITYCALILSCCNALANPVVSGISTNEIKINSDFNGTKILLFGAKGDAGDIIIAVRGPKKKFIITQKEKFFGIWHSGKKVVVNDIYSYYALFSTFNNIDETKEILENLEIGKNNLDFKASANLQDFRDANEGLDIKNQHYSQLKNSELQKLYDQFIENFENSQLYTIAPSKIEFLNETLFKVFINFPKNIIQGTYIVEIYLIRDDALLSFQSIPIYVSQVGINAKITDFAFNQTVVYGIFAIALALFFGWLANTIFVKIFSR